MFGDFFLVTLPPPPTHTLSLFLRQTHTTCFDCFKILIQILNIYFLSLSHLYMHPRCLSSKYGHLFREEVKVVFAAII